MIFKRKLWGNSPVYPMATTSETVIVREACGEHVVGVVSRYSSSDGTLEILSMGDGFGFDHALETALAGLCERYGKHGRDFEAIRDSECGNCGMANDYYKDTGYGRWCIVSGCGGCHVDVGEPSYLFDINGVTHEFDVDHEFAFAVIR